MDFIKTTLNQVNTQENTLYDFIYTLFFYSQIIESEQEIEKGEVCTLEELRKYIDEWEVNTWK